VKPPIFSALSAPLPALDWHARARMYQSQAIGMPDIVNGQPNWPRYFLLAHAAELAIRAVLVSGKEDLSGRTGGLSQATMIYRHCTNLHVNVAWHLTRGWWTSCHTSARYTKITLRVILSRPVKCGSHPSLTTQLIACSRTPGTSFASHKRTRPTLHRKKTSHWASRSRKAATSAACSD
jgi:hypothetical protein